MVAFIGFTIFALALSTAIGVMVATIAPQWQRIVQLAAGHIEPEFQPLAALARAERRITRRRVVAADPMLRTLTRAAA